MKITVIYRIILTSILTLSLFGAVFVPITFANDASFETISQRMIVNVNGTISGMVESDGTPLSGLYVSVKDTHDVVLATNQTTSSGHFDFGSKSFIAGIYTVAIEGGYKYIDDINNSVNVAIQQETHVPFDLTEKEKALISGLVLFNDTVPDGGGNIEDVSIFEPIWGAQPEHVGQTFANPNSNGEFTLWIYDDLIEPGGSFYIRGILENYEMVDVEVAVGPLDVSDNNTLVLTPLWPIEQTIPTYKEVEVLTPSSLSIEFSNAMDPSTFNTLTVSLIGQATRSNLLNESSFEFDNDAKVLTITPTSILTPGMTYTLTIGEEVRTAGNETTSTFPFWTNYVTWFSTAACLCTLEGYVKDNITGEPIEGASITIGSESSITDSLGNFNMIPVWGHDILVEVSRIGYRSGNRTLDILPWEDLPEIDFSLDPLPLPFQPSIENGTTNLSIRNFAFYATFDEALNPSKISSDTIVVNKKTRTSVPGIVQYQGASIVFTADQDLELNTTYVLTIHAEDIENLLGERILWEDWSIEFTTMISNFTSVVVEVTDSDTKDPIVDARVEFEAPGGKTWVGYTGIDGRYYFEELPNDITLNITVTANGYEDWENWVGFGPYGVIHFISMDRIIPDSEKEPEMVVLIVCPFKDVDGNPIADAKITIEFCGEKFFAWTHFSGYATFSIPEDYFLECGEDEEIKVSFEHDDYESQDSEVSLGEIIDDLDGGPVSLTIPENEPEPIEPPHPDGPDYGPILILIIVAVILCVSIIILLLWIRTLSQVKSERPHKTASNFCPRCLSALTENSQTCPSCGYRIEQDGKIRP